MVVCVTGRPPVTLFFPKIRFILRGNRTVWQIGAMTMARRILNGANIALTENPDLPHYCVAPSATAVALNRRKRNVWLHRFLFCRYQVQIL